MIRASFVVLFLVAGCSSPAAPQGGERQDCYPNGTCNAGLVCLSNVCVSMGDASADGAVRDAAGDAGDGASAHDTSVPTIDTGITTDVGTIDDAATDGSLSDASGIDGSLTDAASLLDGSGVDASASTTDAAATDAFVIPDSGTDAGPRCGDGRRDPNEQCDDGNLFDLDGCDASCRYESMVRITSLAISGNDAPTGCTPTTNAVGRNLIASSTALSQFNMLMAPEISNGNLNLLVQALGLTDLTGTNDPSLSIGVLTARPDPAKGSWPGSNPIDWWFTIDHTTVDAMGLPFMPFPATIVNRVLSAGPTTISFPIRFGPDTLPLQMTGSHVFGTIDASPPPNHPAPPPASLDPALLVFQSLTASGAGQGLCGNLTVQSLAQTPVPQALTTGNTACAYCNGSHTYTYCGGGPVTASCNSLLDVFVGGCGVAAIGTTCLVSVINGSQPDVAGGAAVRMLTLGGALNQVTTDLTGDTDAYSSYFTFTANRAHATGESCAATTDCQAGQTCTSMLCR